MSNDDHEDQPPFPFGHSSINEHGGEFLADEHLAIFGKTTTHAAIFRNLDQTIGRSKSTYQNTGRWEADTATIEETFKNGPPCLNMLAKMNVTTYQHNFLIQCSTFFKKKYPDNWEEPLQWVNVTILRPAGNPDKLKEIIRTVRDKSYFYMCQEEPIASFCYSKLCRLEKYGVGNDDGDTGRNLALTVVDTVPATYFVGDGDSRMRLSGDELLRIDKFRAKCLDYRQKMPTRVTQKDWLTIVERLIADAGSVEPSTLYRKHVLELEALEKYFSAHIPNMVRARGDEFLTGKIGDFVRVRIKEERIYFKWDKLRYWFERAMSMRPKALDDMRAFVDTEADFHNRTSVREFFRSSWSFRFNVFDERTVHRWLHPDEPEVESDEDDK